MTVRWSDDEFARYMQHLGDNRARVQPVSEKAFQSAVMRLLKASDYEYVYHTFDSRRSPSGFPDLIAVAHATRGKPMLAVELKTDTGTVTTAQYAWLEALAGCAGVVAEVWRPGQLQEICRKLRDPT